MNTLEETKLPTLEDFIFNELPKCVTILPEDWEGKTKRALITFEVSNQAIENDDFDLRGFFKSKFINSLEAIQKQNNTEKLCLTHQLTMAVDSVSDKDITKFYIHIEYSI